MTRISFWNLRRLGATTSELRRKLRDQTIGPFQPNLELYCEVTTAAKDLVPENFNHRKRNASQLCYASEAQGERNVLQKVAPQSTPMYRALEFAGGNDFRRLVDRGPAKAGVWGGVEIYTFHAPASKNKAIRAMMFIACNLASKPGDWMIVGDFNCKPSVLRELCTGKGINVITAPKRGTNTDMPTFFSMRSGYSTLDYVLTNKNNVTVKAFPRRRWYDVSDHSPILVEF